MTEQTAPYGIADPGPAGEGSEVALGELFSGQCKGCGAVGTHYLTCPDLRLPSGYRLSDPSA